MIERQARAAIAEQDARERKLLSRLFDARLQVVAALVPAVVVMAVALVVAWLRA